MQTPIPKRPPRKAKRWFPYPEGNWIEKIVGVTILALTSPLWVPIWILHLPFRFYRERQEKKERQFLRESTPPPPRDLELERRRIQARVALSSFFTDDELPLVTSEEPSGEVDQEAPVLLRVWREVPSGVVVSVESVLLSRVM